MRVERAKETNAENNDGYCAPCGHEFETNEEYIVCLSEDGDEWEGGSISIEICQSCAEGIGQVALAQGGTPDAP